MKDNVNPKMHGYFFAFLLKIFLGNPCLKIPDLSKLIIADAHIKNLVLLPLRALTNIVLKIALG